MLMTSSLMSNMASGQVGQHLTILWIYLIINKYTVAWSESHTASRRGKWFFLLHPIPPPLPATPNPCQPPLVNRTKLWVLLFALGVDPNTVAHLADLHSDTSTSVHILKGAAGTRSFPTSKCVQQGCILAPFLFTLYVIGLHQAPFGSGRLPKGRSAIASSIVICRQCSSLGLYSQGVAATFGNICCLLESLDLAVIFTKSYVMVIGPQSTSSKTVKVANHTLGKVLVFPIWRYY